MVQISRKPFYKCLGLLTALMAGGVACAQNQTGGNPDPETQPPDPCRVFLAACSDVSRPPVASPSAGSWTPDRRPVMILPLYNGSYPSVVPGGNSVGLSIGWYQDPANVSYSPPNAAYNQALAALVGRLQIEYDNGWRRFMLYIPAGVPYGNVVSGNQWTALPAWVQHMFQTEFLAWVNAHTDATVGVYSGWIYDSCDFNSLSTTGPCAAAYTVTNPDGLGDLINNTIPWQYVGIKEMFFDLSATAPDELNLAARHSAFSGLRLGGEAIPLAPDSSTPAACDFIAHPCYATKGPWVALLQGFWNNGNIMGNIFLPKNTFNPATTEMGMWMEAGPIIPGGTDGTDPSALSLNTMKCVISHGYVPWTSPGYGYAPAQHRIDLVKRIYGFGTVDIRDFNGDGLINPDDIGDFVTAYFTYSAISGFHGNMIHGDVNADGDINADDLSDFITAYYNTSAVNVDFGGPNPERVFPMLDIDTATCQ